LRQRPDLGADELSLRRDAAQDQEVIVGLVEEAEVIAVPENADELRVVGGGDLDAGVEQIAMLAEQTHPDRGVLVLIAGHGENAAAPGDRPRHESREGRARSNLSYFGNALRGARTSHGTADQDGSNRQSIQTHRP